MMENEKRVMARVVKKDPEEREYLVCLAFKYSDNIWEILEGRTATYNFIKNCLETEIISFEESFVLVETSKLQDRKSIYEFMKYIEQFYEDSFDIEDYYNGSEDIDINAEMKEDLNETDNTITSEFEPDDRLSMESFMNHEIDERSID